MSAQPAIPVDEVGDDHVLDPETSAAVMRWMETALVPDGIDASVWGRWVDGGCRGGLEVNGASVTTAMLGEWARSGTLR